MENLKVLIPTNFSVQAEYAYQMVKNLEEKISIEIHFIHVLNAPDTVSIDKDGIIQTCGEISIDYIESQKKIAEEKLNNLKFLYGNHIITHLELGKLTDKIVSYAEENKFDLIVMGTKGAWGLKEKLSGSEAQVIARTSQIPLLSLMCDRSKLSIENILIVNNFMHPKNEQLLFLHKLINAFNTKVHLLQIIANRSDDHKKEVYASMDEFAKLNSFVAYEKHLLEDSDVENGVVHFNQKQEMDMVCIGTHGRGSFFHESATEKLINHLFRACSKT
ncbi:MAG: universal stress protein [Bacteroidia bacterium]